MKISKLQIHLILLGLVADPVIAAIARPEFEDGLRTKFLLGGCWCRCGGHIKQRIIPNPS